MKNYTLFLATTFITLFAYSQTGGELLNNLSESTWYMAPNTKMRATTPENNFNGKIYNFRSLSQNVVDGWSGGAYDTQRNRQMLWGGGHDDYYGNEIYAFDVNLMTWERLYNPDLDFEAGMVDCLETHASGNPRSRHTYGGLAYIANKDMFWAHGGSLACGPGGSSLKTWTYNLSSGNWDDRNPTGPSPNFDTLQEYSVYDSLTGLVFLIWHGQLYSYNYDTNAYTLLNDDQISWAERGCAIDTKRRLLMVVGDNSMYAYNINDLSNVTRETWNTSGSQNVVSATAPGFEYDPVADRMVAWNYGSEIYILNLETRAWTTIQATNGPQMTSKFVYGRFRYIPDFNVFIAISNVDENVFFFKHTGGGALSTENSSSVEAFSVYPNPAKDNVTFFNSELKKIPVDFYNITGKHVFSTSINSGNTIVNISSMSSGLYMVRINSEKGAFYKKMLIK